MTDYGQYDYYCAAISSSVGATAGFQEMGLLSKTGTSSTGLSTSTQYYFKINVDGAGVSEKSITTAADVTFAAVIILINAQIVGCTAALNNGDVRFTSGTTGVSSSVSVTAGTTGTDLLTTMGVSMQSAEPGTASGPTGNILYLLCEKVSGSFTSKSKISNYSGGNSFGLRSGKRNDGISLSNCIVIKYSTLTYTASFNAILFFFKQFTKTSESPAYLWIKNYNDTDLVGIGADAGVTTQYDYMKGYPIAGNWKLERNMYYFDTIKFEECLN